MPPSKVPSKSFDGTGRYWTDWRTALSQIRRYGAALDGRSVVYYVPTDDGDLLIATMAARAKTKAVERIGKVSILILDEKWPVGHLLVYGKAVVERDPALVVDVMMAVGGRMSGEPLGDEARPFVEQMAIDEDRVVLRCTPYATFATPPRHLHRNDQDEKITHWLSGSVAWDAEDPTSE